MSTAMIELPKLTDFPESERTASLRLVLEICQKQQEQMKLQSSLLCVQAERLSHQSEQIQSLRDEISILKGEKSRPKIKPGTLEKDKDNDSSGSGGSGPS